MSLSVLLVGAKAASSAALEQALRQAGFRVLAVVREQDDLFERVRALEPDAIIVDSDSPRRDTLEHLAGLGKRYPRPMVMFAEHSAPDLTALADRSGVCAYVVEGLSAATVRSLVDVAVLHFEGRRSLQAELSKARQTLTDREFIDRAKCLLMEHRGMSERDAYHTLRKLAMEHRRSIADIARRVLRAAAPG